MESTLFVRIRGKERTQGNMAKKEPEMKKHFVKSVEEGSIAQEMEIEPGDAILAIDNTPIEDIFDYQFLVQDTYIEVLVEKQNGEQWLLEVDKEYDEDLGITFENGLMDEYRHCCNKCIFCFIDQMPNKKMICVPVRLRLHPCKIIDAALSVIHRETFSVKVHRKGLSYSFFVYCTYLIILAESSCV